ncbi:MAG: hypothetical protein U9R43_09600 [Thermodesulfobacteriota bacterium]|nr:hypothetical protein [Thermodesulfobacteriota bacterium]
MRPLFFITLIIFIFQPIAHAEITFNFWGAPPEVRIRVGAATGITTVTHNVPATNVGDGTPVAGTPNSILIEASARRASFFSALFTSFIVTADSSTPLSNGTDTIPFTNISWTAQDGDIPSGNFTGSPVQAILSPTRAIWRVSDRHTFYYNNTQIVPYGTYTGRVTYTVSVP